LFAQLPVASQFCGCAPLHRIWPGAHDPWHDPPTHVWFVHALPLFAQLPVASQFWGCWLLHRVWVGPQTPPHMPVELMHVMLVEQADPLLCQLPVALQFWGC
jgi:hypothetical protein